MISFEIEEYCGEFYFHSSGSGFSIFMNERETLMNLFWDMSRIVYRISWNGSMRLKRNKIFTKCVY